VYDASTEWIGTKQTELGLKYRKICHRLAKSTGAYFNCSTALKKRVTPQVGPKTLFLNILLVYALRLNGGTGLRGAEIARIS